MLFIYFFKIRLAVTLQAEHLVSFKYRKLTRLDWVDHYGLLAKKK
jgi:hypothetical protein